MYILSFKTGHDPAACLVEDGKIIAAVEEERFVRIKHATDFFPEHAIRYCLSVRNLTLDGVDYIVFARAKNFRTFLAVFWYFVKRFPRNWTEWHYMLSLMKVQLRGLWAVVLGEAPYKKIFSIIGGRKRKIYSFDHHLCHAASAYYGSGLDEAAVLCMDGKGEATSISLWHGTGGRLKQLRRYGIFSSLGYLYGSITDFLGFRINDGEYKLMGLAAYGHTSVSFDDIISIKKGGIKINTRYSLYPFSIANLETRFPGVGREYNESSPPQPNTDIAATLQSRLEQAALWYVKKLIQNQKPKTQNLCLAGGVALNVKMTKVVWESGLVKNLWIQPAAGDMGNVLGAAWLLYYKKFKIRPTELTHLYFGKEYSDKEVLDILELSGLSFKKVDNISFGVADLISQGKIVAWFQGRFEFGPRALGARSVVADPRQSHMKDVINAKIKFREPFRPFCPSFLEGQGPKLFENYVSSPYMSMSFTVKSEWRTRIPAVVHVDGTVRPQEVYEATNPLYYQMIHRFYEKTDVPIVLNTSLNVKGEPIVNTPEEAINFFKKTDVDHLAIGQYLVSKDLLQNKLL